MSGDTVPVSYTYDSVENRISQQIGIGEETAEYLYTYDTLGQVLSETNPPPQRITIKTSASAANTPTRKPALYTLEIDTITHLQVDL